ncbi:hypothetical protein [Prevotella sp. E2-28]|uniref:hypothetical protein n=1 Tax=Prevotella sp. E2-28 TaxID=2913620 RepID=UPI001EDB4304|nr:hypothetical protein [Prevotella sp. E2-28]UKK53507.1 hypothetical protein L6465_13150 [Prevotella sp. E2-28]
MYRLLFLTLMVLCSTGLSAQRQLTVVDVETLVPVIGANVVGKYGSYVTDSLGMVSVSDSSMTLTFSHVNYDGRIINLSEVRDTVFLISKLLNLKEVVVFGVNKSKRPDFSELNNGLKLNKVEAQLAAADLSKGTSIDLGKVVNFILPKKWRPGYKKAQRKKRLKEILDDY